MNGSMCWLGCADENHAPVVVMTSDIRRTLLSRSRGSVQYVQKPSRQLPFSKRYAGPRGSRSIAIESCRPELTGQLVAPVRAKGLIFQASRTPHTDLRQTSGIDCGRMQELVLNAMDGWSFDPSRKCASPYLRASRMVMYRIADPGPGFDIEDLPHSQLATVWRVRSHTCRFARPGLRPGDLAC